MKTITTFLAITVAAGVAATAASAEFPSKAVSIVVPFGAGGSTDLLTRALAVEMGRTLKQEVVVVNKAGGAGTIGTAEVAAAKNDGYTLGMLPVGPLTTQPHLRRLPYSAASFDYVCLVYSNPQALLVKKDSPYRTVTDFVADAKKHPGKIKYGSSGAGSVTHIAFVAFARGAGIDVVHVPHKGDADNLNSLLGGHIDAFITHTAFLASNAESVRGVGLMTEKRQANLPRPADIRRAERAAAQLPGLGRARGAQGHARTGLGCAREELRERGEVRRLPRTSRETAVARDLHGQRRHSRPS